MGQFFRVVNVKSKAWVSLAPNEKMLEHCYQDNDGVLIVDKLLRKDGLWWKQPVVWAGFYADDESDLFLPDEDSEDKNATKPANLYDYADRHGLQLSSSPQSNNTTPCRYVLNHDKKQFVDIFTLPVDKWGHKVHPLCLLTAEGNGRGGGDYKRKSSNFHELCADFHLVGSWARDPISVQDEEPDSDFEELKVQFCCD